MGRAGRCFSYDFAIGTMKNIPFRTTRATSDCASKMPVVLLDKMKHIPFLVLNWINGIISKHDALLGELRAVLGAKWLNKVRNLSNNCTTFLQEVYNFGKRWLRYSEELY